MFKHETDVLVAACRATAGGDDSVLQFRCREEDLSFDDAESLFAVSVENEWHRGVVFMFDGTVGVEQVVFEETGELPSQGAFPTIAISNKVNQGVSEVYLVTVNDFVEQLPTASVTV